MLGDLSGSLEDFDLALTLDNTFGPGYLARGGVRAISGDIRGAVADLEQFVRLSPTAPQSKDVRLAISRLRNALTEANDTNQ
jgi:regulator of sirC expression with transglutaminase-like and TPR domain